MRKVLIPAAALVLCAGPAAAQQALAADAATPAEAAAVQVAQPQAPAAALYPTTAHVKAQVEAAEARRRHEAPIGSRDWWALVAAVAIGVLIVAVLL